MGKNRELQRRRAEQKERQRLERKSARKARRAAEARADKPEVSPLGRIRLMIARSPGSVFTLLATLASIVGGYVMLRPDVTFTPLGMARPDSPQTASFEVKNASVYSLFDVAITCHVNLLDSTPIYFEDLGVKTPRGGMKTPELERGEKKTVTCGMSPFPGIRLADFTIIAEYRPPMWAFLADRAKSRRFVARKMAAGWTWEEQPTRDTPLR